MSDLDNLFPDGASLTIRGVSYEIKQIGVAQMGVANALAQAAYSKVDLDGMSSELDATSIITDAIVALLDDGELQSKLQRLVNSLAGVNAELFNSLTIDELVPTLIQIVKANKSFFGLRLPKNIRGRLTALSQ